jgi:hypothetical protein
MDEDIRPIIKDWSYRPGKISVRKIVGDDGRHKIQMRLDLGMLQMEVTGRPDGTRPNDCESYYDYYRGQLEEYQKAHHTDIGFELSSEDCRKLRDEALMYYHRYLACFILEDYDQVIDDTHKNLQLFDLCGKYAARKSDRLFLEQYRPYVIMMNTRAKAQQAAKSRKIPLAIDQIRAGLKAIKKLYDDVDESDEYTYSPEVSILKQLGRKMRKKLPADPVRLLEKKLEQAIKSEEFEEAALLRNQISIAKKRNTRRKPKRKKPDAGEEPSETD